MSSANSAEHGAATHVGRRKTNEDSLVASPELGLFLVADGMGGYEGGEVASATVARAVSGFFEANAADPDVTWPYAMDGRLDFVENMLAVSLRLAHAEVLRRKSGRLAAMGSTAAVLLLRGGRAVIAHVGDSRVYRLRGPALERLTRDHSLVAELEARGLELPAEGGLAHIVTRAIGMPEMAEPELRSEAAAPSDVYLLCSDGLTDVLDDEAIGERLAEPSPQAAAEALVEAAYGLGGTDNITAVVVRLAPQEPSGKSP